MNLFKKITILTLLFAFSFTVTFASENTSSSSTQNQNPFINKSYNQNSILNDTTIQKTITETDNLLKEINILINKTKGDTKRISQFTAENIKKILDNSKDELINKDYRASAFNSQMANSFAKSQLSELQDVVLNKKNIPVIDIGDKKQADLTIAKTSNILLNVKQNFSKLTKKERTTLKKAEKILMTAKEDFKKHKYGLAYYSAIKADAMINTKTKAEANNEYIDKNNAIKRAMSNIRSLAEITYNKNNFSYVNVCQDISTNEILRFFDVIKTNSIVSLNKNNLSLSKPSLYFNITCHSTPDSYAIVTPLNAKDPYTAWCIDSTGFANGVTKPTILGANDVTCR